MNTSILNDRLVHRSHIRRITAAFLLTVILAPTLFAGAPNLINYQGRVTGGGSPIADGSYSAQFSFFNSSVGGTLLWQESANITTTEGLFTRVLGSVTPIPDSLFPKNEQVWLEVTVNGQLQSPRTQVLASGFSLAVNTVDNASGGRLSSSLGLADQLRIYTGAETSPGFSSGVDPASGGYVSLFSANGTHNTAILSTTTLGAAGNLSIYGGAPGDYIRITGSGNENLPAMYGYGDSSTFYISTGRSGDAAVYLTSNAIAAHEMLNEPGVTSIVSNSTITLDGTTQTLSLRTLSAPSDGYALVIATAQVNINHTSGTTSVAIFGVSDNSADFPSTQTLTMSLPSALTTGLYNFPITTQTVFPVTQGTNTFYFLGDENLGNFTIYDHNLTIVFLPTAYSLVTPPSPAGGMGTAEGTDEVPVDPETERQQSIRATEARLQAEMVEIKARMEALSVEVSRARAGK